MKEAVNEVGRVLAEVQENLRRAQKDLKAISNALEKGDFSKIGQIVRELLN